MGYNHIVICDEAYNRLKKFAANYNLPMKTVVEWFIFSIIDEDGHPNFYEVEKVLLENIPQKLAIKMGTNTRNKLKV